MFDMPALQWLVTNTPFGFLAAIGEGDTLLALTFGHATPLAAQLDLPYDVSLAHDAWRPAWLPRLQAFLAGDADDLLAIPIDESRYTPFQRAIVRACRAIPYGGTATYGELAERTGYPRAARAVGNVMRSNRCPLVVPCHRVLGSGGLHGYSGAEGLATKARLLQMEQAGLMTAGAAGSSHPSPKRKRGIPQALAR